MGRFAKIQGVTRTSETSQTIPNNEFSIFKFQFAIHRLRQPLSDPRLGFPNGAVTFVLHPCRYNDNTYANDF